MPILAGAAPTGPESPNAARIARVRQHEDFAAAQAWSPPESPEYAAGSWSIYRGKLTLGTGVVLLVLGAVFAGGNPWNHTFGWLGLVGLLLGAYWAVTGTSAKRAAIAAPLLKRPGILLDRRSDTMLRGWGGTTTYYFTIEFEGGVRGEFRFPGRGANEEPYVNNLPGVAYTRGETLLAFRHVRV